MREQKPASLIRQHDIGKLLSTPDGYEYGRILSLDVSTTRLVYLDTARHRGVVLPSDETVLLTYPSRRWTHWLNFFAVYALAILGIITSTVHLMLMGLWPVAVVLIVPAFVALARTMKWPGDY